LKKRGQGKIPAIEESLARRAEEKADHLGVARDACIGTAIDRRARRKLKRAN
jgi:hypothetical protein